ncbi:MAG: malto-oligosyltrehalose trehalohydrolase [Bryobacterales bacterium]|nr:malto-oligosyltrehalose trehalohydrolase [Bryobacterales bacterium]
MRSTRGRAAVRRRFAAGAETLPGEGVHFRVWAPAHRRVELVLENGPGSPTLIEMEPESNGYYSLLVRQAAPGSLYRFQLGGQEGWYPDPASRYQPDGPHGPSQVVDPHFPWTDTEWSGVALEGQVLYEVHAGTFTREGTWETARKELPELAACGITILELMPVADFPGRFGWGYDGVGLYAPTWLYGTPQDFRRFVNDAHNLGLGVILDVVYNHLGPDGNYLGRFSSDYFTRQYENEWGDAMNFDGENSGPVRDFIACNAAYWIEEFHLDGLRLDATQQICDASPSHIMQVIAERVRAAAAGRSTLIVAENEPQETRLVRPADRGGYGLDALWNDDLHHSAMVALTGRSEAYYTDYRGTPQEFISGVKYGYLYQGQRYKWQKKRRGTPALDLRPAQFVNFLQNHDQIANSGRGDRVHRLASPGRYKALTALLLLSPGTPMLFQGQEFAASSPFLYFADHKPELAKTIRDSRLRFLAQFPSLAGPEMQSCLADPGNPSTFEKSKLDFADRERNAPYYALHKDLIRMRREDPVFRRQGAVDGAVLGAEAFVLRFFGEEAGDRLLLVNLGRDLRLDPAPEPLLAPPAGALWTLAWSSEDPRYGGCGTPPPETEDNWRIPGHAALVMRPGPPEESRND